MPVYHRVVIGIVFERGGDGPCVSSAGLNSEQLAAINLFRLAADFVKGQLHQLNSFRYVRNRALRSFFEVQKAHEKSRDIGRGRACRNQARWREWREPAGY